MSKPTQGERGRPPLLTAELTERIVALVKQGLPIDLAAEATGIGRRTVLEWVQRGEGRDEERPAEPIYVEFANRYRQARAEFALGCTQTLLEAMLGWHPSRRTKGKRVKSKMSPMRVGVAQWNLARRFPEFWGGGRETPEMIKEEREENASEGIPQINIILGPLDDEDEPQDALLALPPDGEREPDA
ncbi:MAG: hypothetical protein KF764_25485 [Labilithrix sp.]|nr:hypothetical protein [Labilithrix sp.]